MLMKNSMDSIPSEVLTRLLEYLNGKALSTLWIAAYGNCHRQRLIEQTAQTRLQSLSIDMDANEETVEWIHSVCEQNTLHHSASLCISMIAALIDYLHLCKTQFSSRQSTSGARCFFECPIWVGTLSLTSPQGHRTRSAVAVTTPLELPCRWIPGSSLMSYHRAPTASFRVEPMNLIPLPPWGRLHEITTDSRLLAAEIETGLVAAPSATFGTEDDPLDIRIMTAPEARRRLATLDFLRERYGLHPIVQGSSESLVCCWQDDQTEEPSMRESVDYIIAVMKTYERLQQELHYPS